MELETYINLAKQRGASDLHFEPGLPPALRIRGQLNIAGDPVPAQTIHAMAQSVVGQASWPQFIERRSFDLSKTIAGVRCRINVLKTARGVGMAIRLLASFQASIAKLNLHPELRHLVRHQTGLILVSGPTGSGKSTTMAALLQEINQNEARHILTIECPTEYTIHPRQSYIRQREVGRDTPSFEQALMDALREDPDVIMVGEMRDPETMRLTLNAAETGHLVLATVHSGTCAEALQRIVSAFPAESQNAVCAQLADCLIGVITQRLRFREDLNIRIPECEILISTNPVKAHIRNRDFFKLMSVLETGADSGMWTFQRYQNWLQRQSHFHLPGGASDEPPDSNPPEAALPPIPTEQTASHAPVTPAAAEAKPSSGSRPQGQRIEIEPVEGGLEGLIKELE